MRRNWWLFLALLVAATSHAHAQVVADEVQAPGEDVRDLGVFVVSGVQPGPGLWKLHRGGRTLHILGTVSPLPKGMVWRSDEVAGILDQAGAVLGPPGVSVGSNIGMLRGLALLPSAMRATGNPDGQRLEDVLPAEVYARWARLKPVHIGRDRGIEKKRPMFAAFRLHEKAIERAGLRNGGVVGPVLQAALKRRKMESTSTTLAIAIDDPRVAIADFRSEALKPEDIECFSRTMDIVEHGLPEMVARANAWAIGDIDALRAMPAENQYRACLSAWSGSEVARKRGLDDIDQRMRARWIEVAEAALSEHAVVFATMPVSELLRPGGYLDLLRAKGYDVESP